MHAQIFTQKNKVGCQNTILRASFRIPNPPISIPKNMFELSATGPLSKCPYVTACVRLPSCLDDGETKKDAQKQKLTDKK